MSVFESFEISQRWDMGKELEEAGHPGMSSAVRPMAVAPDQRRIYFQVSFFHGIVEFDQEVWHALQLLSRDSMKTLQELADEAFSDLLHKHGRPSTLKEALRASARRLPANDEPTQRKGRR